MQSTIFLGPQGSGKGTQAERLRRSWRAAVISSGDVTRALANSPTKAGHEAANAMLQGKLIPDELLLPTLEHNIEAAGRKRKLIFDGTPRTVSQAKWLDHLLIKLGRPLPTAIYIKITQAEALKRLQKRLICPTCHRSYYPRQQSFKTGRCQHDQAILIRRADDAPEVARARLRLFARTSRPLRRYFQSRGRLLTVSGHGTVPAVSKRIKQAIKESDEADKNRR